ncbi:MAG: zinc import ATP-binding protein ZnuC [Methyloligella sp.]|nr:MAG: zinc import ATP-binding protein ZnuC [Methyloligella sp.]
MSEIAEEKVVTTLKQSQTSSHTPFLIEANSIGFQRDGRWILRGIDFSISAGEIVTLIGPNGGGKTTFARICLGVLQADEGQLKRASNLSIGYVPQRLKLDRTLPLTVSRFLTVRQKVSKEDLMNVLDEVGSSHLLNAQMSSLSGGEMQRVLLARALVNKPHLLVLDEPAQGVDFAGEAALYDLISNIRNNFGCAVLLISHDLHIVMGSSDRVLCLNGHVCCAGVPEQISHHPEYERLFGPERAQTYGIYAHSHDHSHTLSGDMVGHDCSHSHVTGHSHDCDDAHLHPKQLDPKEETNTAKPKRDTDQNNG